MVKEKIKRTIKNLDEYKPGKTKKQISEKYSIPIEKIVALSSNENPLGTPKKAQKAIKDISSQVFRYPSPKEELELKKEIKNSLDLSRDYEIILDAGEDGVIETIMDTFIEKNDKITIPYPTFSLYELVSRIREAKIDFVKRNKDFSIPNKKLIESVEQTKLSFICSPNNPTGNLIDDSLLKKILKKDNLIVLDAAYSEFTEKNYLDLLKNNKNLIILKTFSKAYGLAGLRVGYGVTSNKELSKNLKKTRSPFSVSKPALVGAKQALKEKSFLEKTISITKKGRNYLENKIPFKTFPSEANFVLAKTTTSSSNNLVEELMKKGVVIRSCTSMKGLGEEYIRISVGKMKENKKAVKAMRDLSTSSS